MYVIFHETGSYENRPRIGRNRSTNPRTDRHLIRVTLQDRRKSSKELRSNLWEQQGIAILPETVGKRLKETGLIGRRVRKKPVLTDVHKQKCLTWAKKYRMWTTDDWAHVIFSDEFNIEMFLTILCV
ncbi:transposable element-related [Holotrichia oblita]|uniref:Transposable element-related n=1 Tax=Holotrichia oblita TaxID=644536 RepID=A0ACB9TEM6_HOLOL|nr:transposable element-related [Holotrichia oblita]